MAEQKIENEKATFSVKHRAICDTCRYRGAWRDSVSEARNDARQHRNRPGNDLHNVWILSQQNIAMLLDE